MVSRTVKILAVLVIVIIAAIFLLPPFAAQDSRNLRTSILVGTRDGEVQHFDQDSNFLGLPQSSIVKVGGIPISYVRWLTDYQATSPDYSQYNLISPSSVKVELFYIASTTPPDFRSCGILVEQIEDISAVSANQYDVDTWYSVGADFMGNAAPNDETAKVTATAISAAAASGCMTPGPNISFYLEYTITISVQAIGDTPVPTDTVTDIIRTTLTLEAGEITGITDTTVTSG